MAEDWSFTEGKEFRARVVRQAILLGFEAEEYEISNMGFVPDERRRKEKNVLTVSTETRWRFNFENITRMSYLTEYHAALEYLRLIKFPRDKIGRVNHG